MSKENDQLELILPSFVLCIRDFMLALEIDGREVTADEYLENCLKLKPGKGPDIERYNRPRESLMKYFPTRKCFTFDIPGSKKTIQQLERLRLEDLSEDFIEETKTFLAYIYQKKPKVLLTSKPVTGQMFVPLVETYVKAIREGAVPDVDNAIMAVARIENERMAKIAVGKFKEFVRRVKLPVLQAVEFEKRRQDLQTTCLAQFRKESVFDKDGKYEREAIVEMDTIWEDVKAENLKLLEIHCKTLLERIYTSVDRTKQDRVYFKKGGYNEYKIDISKIMSQYKREAEGTDKVVAMKVLHRFMEEEGQHETEILISDQQYSEEERKREMEKLHREHLEEQKEQQNMFERRMREEAERAEKHMQRLDEQRMENNRQNAENLKQLTDIFANERLQYDMQIKQMEAKTFEEREAYKKELAAMQDLIREQKEEAESRLQQERDEYKQRTEQVEGQLEELIVSFNQSEEERERILSELREERATSDDSSCSIL